VHGYLLQLTTFGGVVRAYALYNNSKVRALRMIKSLPTLYKLASTGKLHQWTISVDGATIITERGQVGGILTTSEDIVKSGKNVGRANATTTEEQALAEAKSKWDKKLKKDYCKTAEAAAAGKSSEMIAGGILPMLAHKYRDFAHKIHWPAWAQPKLDGHRCTTDSTNVGIEVDDSGEVTLWSRSRAKITSVPHINQAIRRLDLGVLKADGELYNHAYHDDFEIITHLVKRDTPCDGGSECSHAKKYGVICPGYRTVQMHIYDIDFPDRPDTQFKDRWAVIKCKLDSFVREYDHASGFPCPLVAVETVQVANAKALEAAYERFMEQGYEGAMVRNAAGIYHHGKCYDLQKVKQYEDAEFTVIAVEEGRGSMAGCAKFICRIPDYFTDPRAKPGSTFTAKMTGKLTDLRQYLQDPGLAIGRLVTVQFQGFTRRDGVPRFPVVLRFYQAL
jgi:DNA ligase 1